MCEKHEVWFYTCNEVYVIISAINIPGATGLQFLLDGQIRVVRVRNGLFVEPQYGWDDTNEYQAVGNFQATPTRAVQGASGQRVVKNDNFTGENITKLVNTGQFTSHFSPRSH